MYNKNTNDYLDLVSNFYYHWNPNNTYFKDCITSSKREIINKLKKVMIANEKIKFSDEELLNEFDIKIIEQYLRKRKLNKIK